MAAQHSLAFTFLGLRSWNLFPVTLCNQMPPNRLVCKNLFAHVETSNQTKLQIDAGVDNTGGVGKVDNTGRKGAQRANKEEQQKQRGKQHATTSRISRNKR